MKNSKILLIILVLATVISRDRSIEVMAGSITQDISPVSGLTAHARDGQVFLTWKEAETPEGTTINVYVANKPIKDVARVRKAGHHIEQHSARDWWEDPASFTKGTPAGKPVGFIIENGGQRLNPQDGLFVYTLRNQDKKRLYFAVTHSDKNGMENLKIIPGINSLSSGIKVIRGPIRPIWQQEGQQPEPGTGKGKPLWLNLHAKGGVISDMEYLVFGDETVGWRAGLPFKFSVRMQKDEVVVRPTDRVWINRPHNEAGDGGMPAIWTFWYGYNTNIYDRSLMSEGQPVNYTEKRLLWILDWVNDYFQPDTNRWYCSGSSMGGCGTISFGMRHPELFAALHAHVPIVSYTYLGRGSAHRLEPSCWTGTIPDDLKTNEGVPLLDRMNGVNFVSRSQADLPFVFLINGRRDNSIPWENNPPFYRALSETRQGFTAYWDNGEHSTSGREGPPEDLKELLNQMRRFRLNESFPVFTNTSTDGAPGNGNPEDGDLIGWINRGMDWQDIEDTPGHYVITLLANYPGIQYPVRTDVRLRRVQHFKPEPMSLLEVIAGEGHPAFIRVNKEGNIEIADVIIPSGDGVRITIRQAGNK